MASLLPQWLWPARPCSDDDVAKDTARTTSPPATNTLETGQDQGTSVERSEATSQPSGSNVNSEDVEPETTPKAKPAKGSDVPSFNLDESHVSPDTMTGNSDTRQDPPEGKSSSLSPSTNPEPVSKSTPQIGLMAPPSLKAPPARSGRNALNSLQAQTGPLRTQGPPPSAAAQARSSLSPMSITPNSARKKVILQPGHSPLDWATLAKSGNLAGVPNFQRVTPSMLKQHNGRKGKPAWSSYLGKVYNITPYVPFHPGGAGELLRAAGKDGAKLFMEVHPWVNWENMLNSCLVGVLVSEGDGEGLDGLD